jgi:hypothetical protein
MRLGLLNRFPSAVPVTILAAGTEFYAWAATQRAGLTLLPLASDAAPLPAIGDTNLIVDGLDALADPVALLRDLRRATSGARVFALVSNGAYGADLLNFLAGDALAAAHPLVAGDLEALFAAGGWQAVERIPLIDRTIAHGPIPYAVSNRGVALMVTSAEIAERLSTAGFFVIADPQ